MKPKIFFLITFNFLLSTFNFSQDIQFDWKHIIGNGQDNQGKTIAVDSAGYVYVGGLIKGTLTFLDTTVNATGTYEGFVAKLTPAGNMVWFKWFRSGYCYVESICIDRENHLYVTGIYQNSISFDTTLHSNNTDSAYISNMFIAKFDTAGTLLWAKNTTGVWYLAGDGTGPLKKLTVDNDNNLIVTGRCIDKMQYFDTTVTITTLDSTWVTTPFPHWEYYQAETGFLAKYTSSGQKLWVKSIGGVNCDPYAVKTDNVGNIIVTGNFIDISVFDSTTLYTNWIGGVVANIFLAKFNSNGNLNWVERAGGENTDNFAHDIVIDSLNNIYITGQANGNNIEFDSTIYFTSMQKGFVAKYNNAGNIIWLLPISGTYGYSLAINHNNIFMLGHFVNSITFLNTIITSQDGHDIFVLKLDLDRNLKEVGQYVESGTLYPSSIVLDLNNIYITGFYSTSIFIAKLQDTNLIVLNEVNNEFYSNNISVYPNPSHGVFTINNNSISDRGCKFELFNSIGNIIWSDVLAGNEKNIDISNLVKGIYFLRIIENSIIVTKKIIVE